jgi:glycosyltransferase involved in cell wall biosynthesis
VKVLFTGVYKDGTGWGNAAQHYILALDAAGIDVVPRAIKLRPNYQVAVPERIRELEEKSDKDCDVVIQNILPDYFSYNKKLGKNIGLIFTETTHFDHTNWASRLNLMDEIWTGSRESIHACAASHVYRPIHVAPVPCDISKYTRMYDRINIPELKNKFVFYFIGEYTRRKNLTALLKAYNTEFSKHDDVILLIKTHVNGMSPAECERQVLEMIEQVKTQLRIHPKLGDYPNEIIITRDMNEEQIMSLHATCDCFVMPSFAEGWCIPAFDAMAMGKTPIVNDVGGLKDFMDEHCGWMIPNYPTSCFGMQPWTGHNKLYVGTESWWEIDVLELRQAMRCAYVRKDIRKEKANNGIDKAFDFSYSEIGKRLKAILEEREEPINYNTHLSKYHSVVK